MTICLPEPTCIDTAITVSSTVTNGVIGVNGQNVAAKTKAPLAPGVTGDYGPHYSGGAATKTVQVQLVAV